MAKASLGGDIMDFRFELDRGRFIGLEPGAHVDIHLADDLIRQYSIWDWDHNGTWLNVAVKREREGRGGSIAMHALEEGCEVEIGEPRNHFPLQEIDSYKVLIAGGIGATPIAAMAQFLANRDREFQVIYLVRSKADAAFHPVFSEMNLEDRYILHCSDDAGMLDLVHLMSTLPAGAQVYSCGPEPMLNALLSAAINLRGGTVHFERFAAASDMDHAPKSGFEVEVSSTGAVYPVTENQTILEVLQENGHHIDVGCAEGLCGSCMVDVLEGEVDHRDSILSPEEQATNEFMCVCVSRAASSRLVLKL
ncbi:PDR/VanB family oxidoreductase [Leisingera sp. ANG59]|uniref:PDR/VanB family oxidoreductase n=1 Tax=Leisingera sp. ANG59 TaxID=2675221 RepID=UPI00349FE050